TGTLIPTATVPPTATSTSAKPPRLSVTSLPGTATCASLMGVSIAVKNTGGKTLHWQASAPGSVILTPASGSLALNASQTVAVNGQAPGSFNVDFTSDGGQAIATISCN